VFTSFPSLLLSFFPFSLPFFLLYLTSSLPSLFHFLLSFLRLYVGGNKQTGGSGRTTKGARQKGGAKNGLFGFEKEVDRNTEAREYLQLQMLSKQLASSVRAACLTFHTEAEYKKFNIQMPDPASALRKLKNMRRFTQGWYDTDFRAQWLLRVQAVWEKELQADFEAAEKATKLAEAGDDAGAKVPSYGSKCLPVYGR
jgi:hypothetical protein